LIERHRRLKAGKIGKIGVIHVEDNPTGPPYIPAKDERNSGPSVRKKE
jgi:hypothetical protein